MRRHALLASCLLALTVSSTHAESLQQASYQWRNVRVGGGGFSPGLLFSRAEKDLAYLRTDIGGIYRWDAAAKSWAPLQDHFADSSYFGVESIAPDPIDADVVYAAVGMYLSDQAAIIRSQDRGATWSVFPTRFRMGGNEDGRGLGERLAIDPNDTSILYFGSRCDGLQRSVDRGRNWSPVRSFPVKARRLAQDGTANAGISFVVIDPASGARVARSRTLFVGVADPAETHLFRSDDGGESWSAVPGQPRAELLPAQAQIDAQGILYITYVNGPGPNGVTDGAVYRLDTRSNAWSDITPDKSRARPPGGYMGLSLDRQRSGVLAVATVNRWLPGDTIWYSIDHGESWRSLQELSQRDVSDTPFLKWGAEQADFGHWMAGVAIDPFDSSHMAYTTGATVYSTRTLLNTHHGREMPWKPWVEGVEETAVITLASPPAGPQLLSGFGDISGFAHDDLSVSPSTMFVDPTFNNTLFLDFAAHSPNILVRGGTARIARGADRSDAITLAWSDDYGRTWTALKAPPLRHKNAQGVTQERRFDLAGDTAIVTSADGATFIVMTPVPLLTRDRGKSWTAVRGLPGHARIIADRVNANRFYAMDFDGRAVFTSDDGGATFAALPTQGLPDSIREDEPKDPERPWPLLATPGKTRDLWFVARSGLFHSSDGGKEFETVKSKVTVEALAFGKAAQGRDYPALYAIGTHGELRAIWRSDDVGATWLRVNDAAHEYGRRFRTISGDPRIYGRVYVGTDGRGIVYGDVRRE
jgi:xyloglucan-specific exo-beta-1,4-glucanase